ncbi:hypothetical protein ADUPG1_008383 [Aduncisulcus paluster]|uniref:Uncharacterized protein n=1 Tax=Aduncisulcus paluster TaxID=2918883 RepID=A0ABQ5KUR1_9EUKA|nr:hypothetical protein ADUPG1_008383 [Aduncisulcus paluster]
MFDLTTAATVIQHAWRAYSFRRGRLDNIRKKYADTIRELERDDKFYVSFIGPRPIILHSETDVQEDKIRKDAYIMASEAKMAEIEMKKAENKLLTESQDGKEIDAMFPDTSLKYKREDGVSISELKKSLDHIELCSHGSSVPISGVKKQPLSKHREHEMSMGKQSSIEKSKVNEDIIQDDDPFDTTLDLSSSQLPKSSGLAPEIVLSTYQK